MKKLSLALAIGFLMAIISNQKTIAQTKDTLVVITTDYGVIKLKLYQDTPLHRRNFIKLVQEGFYDSLLFHRVIKNFMIQGGDPNSKRAKKGEMLGNGDVGYTIPAEFVPTHFHKKGALAAARQGDDVNPKKESSGCQFYIVHGRKFSEGDMLTMDNKMVNQAKQNIFMQHISAPENASLKNRFMMNQQSKNADSLAALNAIALPIVEAEYAKQKPAGYTAEQKAAYINDGGAPHLDGGYTVFGEVVEGLEIIDKIGVLEGDANNRPSIDSRMKMSLEIKK